MFVNDKFILMTIPQIYRINDSREPKTFSKYTFSGFLKTEVNSTFQKKLYDSKLLHAPGLFFSPTRNQTDTARDQRHIADWAKKLESKR